MESARTPVARQTYAGLFLVTLATLMYEILLTRVFSVIMWYHFAFMAVSVAMFGMTVGAIAVYLLPARIIENRAQEALGFSALSFGLLMVACLIIQSKLPYLTRNSYQLVSASYILNAFPFFLSGVCVCLALTKLPAELLGKLYAADLAGAAFGCILFGAGIRIVGGPALVFLLACFAALGAAFFFTPRSKWRLFAGIACILLVALSIVHSMMASADRPFFKITWAKGVREGRPIWERWNSFSRIRVTGNAGNAPFGWGYSSVSPAPAPAPQELLMEIDSAAGTVLTRFDGSTQNLDYLKYDIINLPHYIRSNADVYVIGVGGGRDVLSSLAFGQKSVVGVEINDQILKAVNEVFGDFTGHLDRNPAVEFANDDARSYLARQKRKYDIIQVSLIDTWAATAAGAFALTENSLYTVEAWKVFLEHLKPGGVLAFSRWYIQDRPAEMYRLTSLATESLLQTGAEDPRKQVIVVRNLFQKNNPDSRKGVGTILVSTLPFTAGDLATLESVAERLKYEMVLTPTHSLDTAFEQLTSKSRFHQFADSFPLDISATTDDRPFFFNMLRWTDAAEGNRVAQGPNTVNLLAVYILGDLTVLVLALTLVFVILPLFLTTRLKRQKGVFPFSLFFASIGWGFMMIEISQMQRLIVFLGHPAFSLTVVLFALLLSGGIGSFTTQRITGDNFSRQSLIRIGILLCLLVLQGALTSPAIHAFYSQPTWLRILLAIALLFPPGFFMGMAFPLGMKLASSQVPALTPWFWGINGGMTVCASVVAVGIALILGISAAYWTGVAFYCLAALSFVIALRNDRSAIPNRRPSWI